LNLKSKPNRAPNFSSLYANQVEFEYQREKLPLPSESLTTSQLETASKKFEQFKVNRKLPTGFSTRAFSLDLAKEIGGKIVSEHDGKIDFMLISVPRDTKPIDPLDARHYSALFKGLGSWVKYIVVCDPRQQKSILELAIGAGLAKESITFALSPRFNYSIWAQDAYVAINDSTGAMILCEGISFPRYEDMTIADDAAAQSDISLLQSYLYFQGGNVLGSGSTTLIGMDYIERNTRRHRLPDIDAVKAHFSDLLGTEILPLGGKASGEYAWYESGKLSGHGFQPIFHIDMYVTPTGIVGASGKEIVFLGRPEAAKSAVGKYSDIPDLNNGKYNSFFDETETALAAKFEVRYLPLWLTAGTLGYPVDARYYNLTFNNCIVQNASSMKKVLLPSYSQDAAGYGVDGQVRRQLELAAEVEWKKIGFEVAWMDGVEDLAFNQGAVHCITKTLRRKA
jgi:hypothetical protein